MEEVAASKEVAPTIMEAPKKPNRHLKKMVHRQNR